MLQTRTLALFSTPCCHLSPIFSGLQTIGSKNLLAIVGLYEEAVRLATEELHIPYLALTPVTSKPRDYTLELLPTLDQIGAAVYDLTNAYDWSKVSVFYDDDRGTIIKPLFFRKREQHSIKHSELARVPFCNGVSLSGILWKKV